MIGMRITSITGSEVRWPLEGRKTHGMSFWAGNVER